MPKRCGMLFVVTGTVFIFIALSLFLHNRYEDKKAGEEADIVLKEVQESIERRTGGADPDPKPEENPVKQDQGTTLMNPELPIVEIDGYGYIGYLSIPALEVELPVMEKWDYNRLKIAPCRQFGAPASDDLVIAAHNYRRHFGSLEDLKIKDQVVFTDMNGRPVHYTVASTNHDLSPEAVDDVQNSNYDLVLYTCTYTGQARVVIYCDRVTKQMDVR